MDLWLPALVYVARVVGNIGAGSAGLGALRLRAGSHYPVTPPLQGLGYGAVDKLTWRGEYPDAGAGMVSITPTASGWVEEVLGGGRWDG